MYLYHSAAVKELEQEPEELALAATHVIEGACWAVVFKVKAGL